MAETAHRQGPAIAAVTPLRPGFDALDDAVRALGARGMLQVRVGAPEIAALERHLERRARAAGRRVVRAGANVESAWRDIASRLGLAPCHEPEDAARALVQAAASEDAVVIACPAPGAWDQAVSRALAEHESDALFVVLSARAANDADAPGEYVIGNKLDAAGLARWWDALAAERSVSLEPDLAALDAWASVAATSLPKPARRHELGARACALLVGLSLARRAWPSARVAELGDESALVELASLGLIEARDGLVSVLSADESGASAEQCVRVARGLARVFAEDAWALARAAELFARAGLAEDGEKTMELALRLANDGSSRADLWSRWRDAVEAWPAEQLAPARLRGAELALALGDVEVALEWAQRASSAEPKARAAFVLGRAALARGDLVSAAAALGRARDSAAGVDERSAAVVQIAEVRYSGGQLDEAAELARDALAAAEAPSIRLAASNLLGKLLLARGEWVLADAHFAADEHDAVAAGDLTGELRARVNRAIALLSLGSSEEAGAMLRRVLEDAEARNERLAVGFALSNLAVLAIERHDYAEAVELLERTILAHRRLGDRLNFARDITNLVELRLRLGLVDQAAQALRFGRHSLGPGAPASRLAELALAAAQVHLAKGHTLEAEREVRAALRTASQSTDGDKLGECHRVAARIALDDGMVARAEAELSRARELAVTPFDRAEVAVLEILAARAAGRASSELAKRAVVTTRESGDEELAREAHVLCAEIALGEGDDSAAASHVAAAAALRDEVASKLSASLREAYLARPALIRLARLERVSADVPQSRPGNEHPSEPPRRAEPVRYVGRHPAVRALLDSVARVGRAGSTVLINGESGTGKELLAELLHSASDRKNGPLVKVNCSALVETLLLSELFGHEKGAFTGANAKRRGRFERANGGTLFLDEIGDISPRTQVALLRVLEEKRIERVGGSAPLPVDVRIVCATHRDLKAMVERGEFREDLYYRLCGITLQVPSLRDRLSDLPTLCDAMLDRIARERGEAPKRVSSEALDLLSRHRWPGNVRELENALRAVSVLSDSDVLDAGDFIEHVEALRRLAADPVSQRREPASTLRPQTSGTRTPEADVTHVAYTEVRAGLSLSDLKRNIERECIVRALNEADGNITRAATILGMKRPRLSQLVKEYGLLSKKSEEP